MTKPVPIEATIRPVFIRPRTDSQPRIFTYIKTVDGTDNTQNIQPAVGQIWSVNYIQILMYDLGTGTETMEIRIIDGANTIILKQNRDAALSDVISFGAFGNGPLLLTNSFYLQTYVSSSAGEAIFHIAVSVSEA